MKQYEVAFRSVLPRRLPLIVRVDGRAFHTLTRNCEKPFDFKLINLMNDLAIRLCEEADGASFGYVQSDEISIFIHNYKTLRSSYWFNNEVQKIVSVTAGLASAYFTSKWGSLATFDTRVFLLPEPEVANYFIWRQQDCTRNSITMATRSVYSHKEVDGKDSKQMQEMLHEKGINWNNYPIGCKRGRAVVKKPFSVSGTNRRTGKTVESVRHRWAIDEPPIFSRDREYIERHLRVEEEEHVVRA